MSAVAKARSDARPLLEVSRARITAPGGRLLFDDLNLSLPCARVALVGRNGVGKSTLLAVLAGHAEAAHGKVTARGEVHLVPQILPDRASTRESHGQRRMRYLSAAEEGGAPIVLLDEPTSDLDDAGLAWLRGWLARFTGCLVVATHDRRLLQDFAHFLVAREAGSRSFSGTLAELDDELARDHAAGDERYARALSHLARHEERTLHLTRRRARKKRYGRCSELDRATPKIRLNQKRDHAQVYQGKFSRLRESRLATVRAWAVSLRRALEVRLPLHLTAPVLPKDRGAPLLALQGVSAGTGDRSLFGPIDLHMGRERVAVVGPNGSGKTTLLEIANGRRAPTAGKVERDSSAIGAIAQGGTDWMLRDSLLAYLHDHSAAQTTDELAQIVVAHRFPLALASRPMASLSPGERVRAALLCLFQRVPSVELLVLDEPTFSLDLVGQRALVAALRAWPGGLLVASHDPELLRAIDWNRTLALGR